MVTPHLVVVLNALLNQVEIGLSSFGFYVITSISCLVGWSVVCVIGLGFKTRYKYFYISCIKNWFLGYGPGKWA